MRQVDPPNLPFNQPRLWLALTLACLPELAQAADGEGVSTLFLLVYAVGIVLLSVVIIFGLTRWGSRQDEIQSMMPFCIRYLVESGDEHQKIEAAKALGKAKDPGALLILVDIINDIDTSDALRSAGVEALQMMVKRYHRYSHVIPELLEAAQKLDHQRTIDILTRRFERGSKKYVQSAYVIGRKYVRMEEYSEARRWLQQARNRNLRAKVYIDQISQLIERCNQSLFREGDVLFKVEEYYDALERYALASHDMVLAEKHRYAAHLRLACTYCKLERYEDAFQETLHALQDEDPSEESIELNKLLQEIRGEIGSTDEAKARRQRLTGRIDSLITTIFSRLN
jgi:tetratricopeptide (TPR) repeat protein